MEKTRIHAHYGLVTIFTTLVNVHLGLVLPKTKLLTRVREKSLSPPKERYDKYGAKACAHVC